MVQGLASAAAGLRAQQTRLDNVANDVANVNTTGYKRTRTAFRDLVYVETGPGAAPGVRSGAGAAATLIGRGAAQGTLRETQQPLDVAIVGSGYLRVQTPSGPALTRDGALQRNDAGELVTTGGGRTGVRIPATVTNEQVRIAQDGTVSAGGRTLGRLDLVSVRSPESLRAMGDGLFSPGADAGVAQAGAGTTVRQGHLEASNVDMADAMSELMQAQRAFELASRAVQTQDQILQIANQVKK